MRFSVNLVFFVSIDDSHNVPLSSNAHCLSVPTTSQERANSKADGLSCPPTPLSLPRRYYSAGRNRLPWERTSRQNTIIQPQVHGVWDAGGQGHGGGKCVKYGEACLLWGKLLVSRGSCFGGKGIVQRRARSTEKGEKWQLLAVSIIQDARSWSRGRHASESQLTALANTHGLGITTLSDLSSGKHSRSRGRNASESQLCLISALTSANSAWLHSSRILKTRFLRLGLMIYPSCTLICVPLY